MSNETPQVEAPLEQSTPQQDEKKRGFWGGVFPTTVDLLAILGIFLVAQLISLAATYMLGYSYDRLALSSADELTRQIAQTQAGRFSLVNYSITMLITIGGALLIRMFRGSESKAPIARFSMRGFNPTVLLWGMLLLLSISVIFDPLMRFMPTPPELYGRGWAMILTLIVLAPIFEELLCRGIILESVMAKSGVWAACTISSIFFAVMHLHPTAAVNALIIGLMLSYIYIRTSSLFAPIILHAFNNALAYMLVWLGFENVTLWEIVAENKMLYMVIYISAAGILIMSLIKIISSLTRMKKEQEPKPDVE